MATKTYTQEQYEKLVDHILVYRYYNTVFGKPIISPRNLGWLVEELIKAEASGQIEPVSHSPAQQNNASSYPEYISDLCEKMNTEY